MFGLFKPKLETRLTNASGFPHDMPAGLILVTADGFKWKVTERVSDTVLVLVPLRWWHRRDVRLVVAFLAGVGLGLAGLWWAGKL